jgi:hypothetical protein
MTGGRRMTNSARLAQVERRAQKLSIQTKRQQGKVPTTGTLVEMHAEVKELATELHDIIVGLSGQTRASSGSESPRSRRRHTRR